MHRTSVVALSAILALLTACQSDVLPVSIPGIPFQRVSEEEQIAVVLEDVRAGMQSRRIYQVTAHVSRSYRDDDGRDYDAIVSYLTTIFENYRDIRITRVPPQIAVDGATAQVLDTFGTIAEPRSADYPPINLDGRVLIKLEKISGEWMIMAWSTIN